MQVNPHHLPGKSFARYMSSKRRKVSPQDRLDDLILVVEAVHKAGLDKEDLLHIQEACDEFELVYRDGMFQSLKEHVRYAREAIHAKDFEKREVAREKLQRSRYALSKLGVNV